MVRPPQRGQETLRAAPNGIGSGSFSLCHDQSEDGRSWVAASRLQITAGYFFFFFFAAFFFFATFFLAVFFLGAAAFLAVLRAAFFLATVRPPLIEFRGELLLTGLQCL